MIESVNAELVRAVVTELRGGTYYATLALRANGRIVELDVRPSDAIAVAVRLGAPILVRESLFDEAQRDEPVRDDSGQAISFEPLPRARPGGSAPATPALKL